MKFVDWATLAALAVVIVIGLLEWRAWLARRQVSPKSREPYYMGWQDIGEDDQLGCYPGPGWYSEWRGMVFGPFERESESRALQNILRQKYQGVLDNRKS